MSNPKWVSDFNYNYSKSDEIPQEVFDKINHDLDKIIGKDPLITILIPAWNEEVNILKCISSLSKTKVSFPIEIIVVNNNSTDNTQQTIDRLHVKGLFEKTQGPGPARQLGQEHAQGKYILLADADCFYPSCWVDEMSKVLRKEGVVCVYGRYSFLSEDSLPRWKLFLLERMKDVISEFRQINRPYLNTFGISMGYNRELGLKVGFVEYNFRGEDGQLALGLMKYGKIKQVRNNNARAWTGARTLKQDKNIILVRVIKEMKRFFDNFHSKLPPDAVKKSKKQINPVADGATKG